MRAKQAFLTIAHRLAILAYIAFALFPLFWLLKVAVTPNDLLYSEGIRLWPSRASLEHFDFVLRHSAFPVFFRNSLIVSGSTAVIVTILASLSGYALSRFRFRGKYWLVTLMLLTQMFPLVMLVAPIFKILSPLGLTNSLTGLGSRQESPILRSCKVASYGRLGAQTRLPRTTIGNSLRGRFFECSRSGPKRIA
jgi:multiple sugar transport system permease protein